MNYSYSNIETATDMTPSVPVERETLKSLMQITSEHLNEAVITADAILSAIRGAYPKKDEERTNADSAMMAERQNCDTAERLCATLNEIALQIGLR